MKKVIVCLGAIAAASAMIFGAGGVSTAAGTIDSDNATVVASWRPCNPDEPYGPYSCHRVY